MDLELRVQQIAENTPDIVKYGRAYGIDDKGIRHAVLSYCTTMILAEPEHRNVMLRNMPFSFDLLDGTIIPF